MLFFMFFAVVSHFYEEYHKARHGGYGVGDYQRPIGKEKALHYKEYASKTQEEECGQCNAIGVASANGVNGLWKVTENHAESCKVTYDVDYCFVDSCCEFHDMWDSVNENSEAISPGVICLYGV